MRDRLSRVVRAAVVAGVGLAAVGTFGSVQAQSSDPESTTSLMDTRQVDQPPGSSSRFGRQTVVLANGNFVVSDPGWADGDVPNVGAVYLYDGLSHELISRLTGSQRSDGVGSVIDEVGDSNFVVTSRSWGEGGAWTWVDGDIGLDGPVTASNSLIADVDTGLTNWVTTLANGNYVVSRRQSNDSVSLATSTWANGNTGIVGMISESNSVMNGVDVVPLTNGNYVLDAGGGFQLVDGTAGLTGLVDVSETLHGSTPGDLSGSDVIPLANGGYVVSAPGWDSPTAVDAGAVVLGDAVNGVTGPITTANSLHGTTADDQVGTVTALANGNFVVRSRWWDNGDTVDAGAVTFVDGGEGAVGPITTANSLHGTSVSDQVGASVTALVNGNFVVSSPRWDFGVVSDAGASTWGSGTTGIAGPVTSVNSLHGTRTSDGNGSRVVALANGNYVVRSSNWNLGSVVNSGAVTWGSGATGISGPIAVTNSLYGLSRGDSVGGVWALSNGNYLVGSPWWDNGDTANAGAMTWADGSTGLVGPVSTSNSLFGVAEDDVLGGFVYRLSNGNALVSSVRWLSSDYLTFLDGNTGLVGPVSVANSLFGSRDDESLERYQEMPNGQVLIQNWDTADAFPIYNPCFYNELRTIFVSGDAPTVGYHTPRIFMSGHWVSARRLTASGSVLLYRDDTRNAHGSVVLFGGLSPEISAGLPTGGLAKAHRIMTCYI